MIHCNLISSIFLYILLFILTNKQTQYVDLIGLKNITMKILLHTNSFNLPLFKLIFIAYSKQLKTTILCTQQQMPHFIENF